MKKLEFLNEEIRNKVTPLITYLDMYYSYNENKSNQDKVVYYGNESDYVILKPTNENLIITYSNFMSVVFARQNYPFVEVSGDDLIFKYDKPLPYVLIYVTIDRSLDK